MSNLDQNTVIKTGENGLPDLESLYLAGKEGLEFLYNYARKIFGPEFDAAKVEFARLLTEGGGELAQGGEKVVEDAVNAEVEKTLPVAEPIVQDVESQLNSLTNEELAKLGAAVQAKLTGGASA